MIPTNLFAAFLTLLAGIDPATLRKELDSAPWRPSPGATIPVPTAPDTLRREAVSDTPANPAVVERTSPRPVEPTASNLEAPGIWQLQLAALSNPDVARREQIRLEKELGAGSLTLVQENGLTKIRWGRYTSREAADAARAELKANRLDGFPVKAAIAP